MISASISVPTPARQVPKSTLSYMWPPMSVSQYGPGKPMFVDWKGLFFVPAVQLSWNSPFGGQTELLMQGTWELLQSLWHFFATDFLILSFALVIASVAVASGH